MMLVKEIKTGVRNGLLFSIINEESIFIFQRDISIFEVCRIPVSF